MQSTTYAAKGGAYSPPISHQDRADEAVALAWYDRTSHLDAERRCYALDLICAGVDLDDAIRLFAFALDPENVHRRYFEIREQLPQQDYSAAIVVAVCRMEDHNYLKAPEILRVMAGGSPEGSSREILFSQLPPERRRTFENCFGRGF